MDMTKTWARGYKTFFILNSVEHEIYLTNIYQNTNNFNILPAEHSWAWNLSSIKYQNANICWHFNIY